MIRDELILRSLKRETSEAEERALLAWRGEGWDNEERYRRIAKLWELRPLLEASLHLEGAPTAGELLRSGIGRSAERRHELEPAESRRTFALAPRRPNPAFSRVLRAAAAALLLLAAGTIGYLTDRGGERATAGSVELITAATEISSARLADGSMVRLAPESRLRVEISRTSRRAWLNGRAFFAVDHDPSRPFSVQTHAGEVLVMGTRFDLEARAGELQLVVVDGAVELAAAGDSIEVHEGQLSRVRDGGRPEVETLDDVYEQLDWVGNFVAFQSTPLREVVRELEQRFGLRIQIQDSGLAEQTVTSWSMNRSPREILAAVCVALNAFCTTTDTLTTIEY